MPPHGSPPLVAAVCCCLALLGLSSLAAAARGGGAGGALADSVPELGLATARASHSLEPAQVRALQAAAARRPQPRHVPAELAHGSRRRRAREVAPPVRRALDELEDTSGSASLSSADSEPASFTSVSELIKYTQVARLRTTSASMPRLTGNTYTFRAISVYPFSTQLGVPTAPGALEYEGIAVDILKDIAGAGAGDFSIRFAEPNSTLAGRRGALNDVSVGLADATVGPLTVVSTNLPIVYTTPYMQTGLVLVTLVSPAEPAIAIGDMYSWMLPFTWGVWGMIIAIIIVYGGIMFLIEQNSASPDFDSVEEKGLLGLWKSVYLSGITFMGQLAGHFPATAIGRVLMQATAFTAIILSSSYTANLATFLTASRVSTDYSITNINDAQLLGSKVCVQAGSTAEGVLTRNYNRIQQVQITGATTEEMISSGLASLRSAMCEGMVMDELVARAKIVEPTGENCDIRIAGTVFLQQSYAVAVRKVGRASPEYERLDGLTKTLNYYFTKMRIEGNLTQIYVDNFVKSSPCASTNVDSNQIGAKQVMGPLVLFYAIAFFSIVAKMYTLLLKKKRESRALGRLKSKLGNSGGEK
eukprot:jgi/Tetstr1/431855/TSEL_021345.t1